MRILMWLVIGFGAACALAAYLLSAGSLLWLALGCAVLCAAAALLGRDRLMVKSFAVILAGLSAGFGWYMGYEAFHLRQARAIDGMTLELNIQTTDYSYETDYGVAVDGKLRLDGREYRVRAYVDETGTLPPGTLLQGSFRMRYTARGGQEDPTHHRGEGIFLLAYPQGQTQVTVSEQAQFRYIPAYLRQKVTDILNQVFPEDTSAFARALLLGDSSGLSYEMDTAFKLSGIRHIIAVSGLHVAILFSLVYGVTFRRRYLSAAVGIPVLVLFAAIAGFTPSIVRACLMQLIMLLAAMLSREYDPPSALSFAVLVMLAVNPQSVTSAGFQLSVASVAGILMFAERIREWLLSPGRLGTLSGKNLRTKLKSSIASSVSVTLSAMVFTTPLIAGYFGTVSLIGAATNLLTLWIISFVFCGIIAACIVSLVFFPAGEVIAWCISWPIRFVTGTAQLLGGFPFAAVYTQSVYIVIWLVFVYALLAVFICSARKRSGVLVCCAAVGLCAALLASWLETLSGSFRMTVLDVEQGQCVLLQSEGKTYMVDCGGSHDESVADLAAATLLSQGITHLDGLILTHYDRDHTGAAAMLLSRVPADVLYLPNAEDTDQSAPDLRKEDGIRVTQDIALNWGSTKLTIFAAQEGKTDNESSLCVLFQTEKCDILITGDRSAAGELELLRRAELPGLEVLVAGHHGAAASTGIPLLRGTLPKTVVISVEADNRYGHPSEELLQRLSEYGCTVRRTDLEGTIIIRG